jgi:hypothetical protein
MLAFARDAAAYTKVLLSVVNVLSADRIKNCQRIADDMGVPLRIR